MIMFYIKGSDTINTDWSLEIKEILFIIGEIINWFSTYGKQYRVWGEILKKELLYDPAIQLLGSFSGTQKY